MNSYTVEEEDGKDVATTAGIVHAPKGARVVWDYNPNVVDVLPAEESEGETKAPAKSTVARK